MKKARATGPTERIHVANHRDLRKHMRAICERFNAQPEIARLVFVNPVLALQDVGVQLEPEAKQHIMDALRFPPRLQKRKAELAEELVKEFAREGIKTQLPLSPEQRAELLFRVMRIPPLPADAGTSHELAADRVIHYAKAHPLAAKLAEYETLHRGRLIFQPRETYEAYKSGKKRHRWIKSVRFKI
jgi:hypothetical protein